MDAHSPEYAAAVVGMQELYGSPAQPYAAHEVAGRLVNRYAVGDAVMFDSHDGTARMARIEEACNDDFYLVRCDDRRCTVIHADVIYPF